MSNRIRGLLSLAVAPILIGWAVVNNPPAALAFGCGGVGCFYAIAGIAMLRK